MWLEDNAEPNHCCLCGRRNQRSLCLKCFDTWAVGGKKPEWLRVLHNDAQKKTKRHNRNRVRLRRTEAGLTKRKATPFDLGITLVSLYALGEGF